MTLSPQASFESFLAQLIAEEWIKSYEWSHAATPSLLKSNKKKLPQGWSRSHKSNSSGESWVIDVQALPGSVVGVDLELILDRPILQNPKWLADRFGMSMESLTPQDLLQEWVRREAVFKACAPDNAEMMLSSFCKMGPTSYGLIKESQESSSPLVVETRICTAPDWIMAIGRRIL